MAKKKKTTRRTEIKDLSKSKKKLSDKEMKKITGGRQPAGTTTAPYDNDSTPANTTNPVAINTLTTEP